MSEEQTAEQTIDRTTWDLPRDYPYAVHVPPNPRRQESHIREMSEQVEFLTKTLSDAVTRIGDLEEKVKKPPVQTVNKSRTTKKTPAKSGGGD